MTKTKTAKLRAAEAVPPALVGALLLGQGGVTGGAASAALLVTGLLLATTALLQRRSHPCWVTTPLDLPLLGALVWSLVAAALSPAPGSAMSALVYLFLGASTFWLSIQVYRDPGSVRRGALYLLAVAALAGVFVGAQLIPERPLVNPNHNAGLLALTLPVAVAVAAAGSSRNPRWVRPAAAGCAALVVGALIVTRSRGALGALALAGAVAAGIAVWRGGRRWAVVAATGAAAGGVLLATADPLSTELTQEHIRVSFAERTEIWRTALAAFAQRPGLGWGPGNFHAAFAAHRAPDLPYAVAFAHQEPLQLLVDGGLPALLLAVVLGVVFVAAVWPRLVQPGRHPLRAIAVGASLSLLVGVLHAQVDFAHRIPAVAALAGVLAALAIAASRAEVVGSRRYLRLPSAPGWASYAAAGGGLLLVAIGTVWARGELIASSQPVDWARATAAEFWSADVPRQWGSEAWLQAREGNPAAFAQAAQAFETSLERNPLQASTWADLAAVRQVTGDLDAAIAASQKAVELDPMHPTWRLAFAHVLLEAGEDPRAVRQLRELITLHPDESTAAARAIVSVRGFDLGLLERVLDDPAMRARYLARNGFAVTALAAYADALEADPDDGLRADAVALALDTHHPDRALAWLADAGNDSQTWLARGRAYEERNEPGKAAAAYDHALELDPQLAAAHHARAHLAEQQEDDEEAVGLWEAAAQAQPDDPAPYIALSRIEARRGQLQASLARARRARTIAPCDATAIGQLVRVYERLGLRTAAARELEDAAVRCGDDTFTARLESLRQ